MRFQGSWDAKTVLWLNAFPADASLLSSKTGIILDRAKKERILNGVSCRHREQILGMKMILSSHFDHTGKRSLKIEVSRLLGCKNSTVA